MSGGAPLFIMCLCLQSRKDVSCSLISFFPCLPGTKRTCNTYGYTMKISSRYHKLLICDVKRNREIDGMGLFKGIH